jgi:aspartate racemase
MERFNPIFVKTTDCPKQIRMHLDEYEQQLEKEAEVLKCSGQEVKDQSFACGTFSFQVPSSTSDSHLLLLGGMGPLAGVYGMRNTLDKIDMNVTLFQACAVPRRSFNTDIAPTLSTALIYALECCPSGKKIELVVLCNSAHPFMDEAIKRVSEHIPNLSTKLRFHSLKASVEKNTHLFENKKSIALQTDFSSKTGVYGSASSLRSIEEVPALISYQNDLNDAIEGVKAFDKERILMSATKVFKALKEWGAEIVLLGCTEMPIIVEHLKKHACEEIREYLNRIELIDPLHIAFAEIAKKK